MNTTEEILEKLIDEHSMFYILQTMVNICYDKSNHIRESYQDNSLANKWLKQAHELEKVKTHV
jgi:hypothetical protein